MRFHALSTMAALALGSCAWASIPVMQVSLAGSGGGTGSSTPTGTATGVPNQYNYQGGFGGTGLSSTFNLNAYDLSATDREILGGTVSVINTAASTQTFTLTIAASTVAQGTSSLTGGSVAGTLTGNADGGYFAAGAVPGWSAVIRNGAADTTVASLWSTPFSVSTDPNMVASVPSASFGAPIPSQVSTAMGTAAVIKFVFDLGAGDRVDFSTVFVIQSVVPAPGAVAGLAMVGGFGRRRRRG